jgi:hypothetical protein
MSASNKEKNKDYFIHIIISETTKCLYLILIKLHLFPIYKWFSNTRNSIILLLENG